MAATGEQSFALTSQAFAALTRGELAEAEAGYRRALELDPNARDALDGLGAMALRAGRRSEAAYWFRRSIASDPTNEYARAALARLARQADAGDHEAGLRQTLQSAPDNAPGHFALGNLLAHAGRWAQAQEAYFRAHALDEGNPDYLFNLAVALEHLGQPALARAHYERALRAAGTRLAAFDATALRARVDEWDSSR